MQELSKIWHRDTKWTNAVGKEENGDNIFAQHSTATNLQFVKPAIPAKHHKVKSAFISLKYKVSLRKLTKKHCYT